jgi:hypothetical protein
MNAMIAALTNYLYVTLSKKDFLFWNVFFGELSKSMFGMEILRGICMWDGKGKGHGQGHEGHDEHENENFAYEHDE